MRVPDPRRRPHEGDNEGEVVAGDGPLHHHHLAEEQFVQHGEAGDVVHQQLGKVLQPAAGGADWVLLGQLWDGKPHKIGGPERLRRPRANGDLTHLWGGGWC